MFRYLTSGESHGKQLSTIIEGLPAGLKITADKIDADLKRRQGGYGRGGRMLIESDSASIVSGVRHGSTLGSPVALIIENRDWENWLDAMDPAPRTGVDKKEVKRPRPGHADLTGAMKYGHSDIRNVLERSSARETAARVAVGAVAKGLLAEFGISIYSWVTEVGGEKANVKAKDCRSLHDLAERSVMRCPVGAATKRMTKLIDNAKAAGDSLGGSFEVVAVGVPPGLGSYVHWDRKLDALISMAIMSIQAIKGVEVGLGFDVASTPGSRVQDEIFYGKHIAEGSNAKAAFWPQESGFYRRTNGAGGIEGGMSNGAPIVIKAAMKPIPTLYKPLRSVDIDSKKAFKASVERSDCCAVPAASVIGEAVVAIELAGAFLDKFGGDSIVEIRRNYKAYLKAIASF